MKLYMVFLLFVGTFVVTLAKSSIEPCRGSHPCTSLLAYKLPTDLKVSEVATRFQVKPLVILGANGFDPTTPGAQTQILAATSLIKVPVKCECVNGIRKSVSTVYRVQTTDTLHSIADSVFGGLVTGEQIGDANRISGDEKQGLLDSGQSLVIPLLCSCFNGTDNGLPAVYVSYVVRSGDSLASVGRAFQTTVTDLMTVNSLQNPLVEAGDLIAVPLAACSSGNLNLSSDSGLIVANGSYAIIANDCVQCNCGPKDMNLYCVPAPLAISCPSMQCKDSNLLIGDVIEQQTSAGCNVTSCLYSGYSNRTIVSGLKNFLQPQCFGKHLQPVYMKPPTLLISTPQISPIPKSPLPSTSPPSAYAGVVKSNPSSEAPHNSCSATKLLRWITLTSILISGVPYLIHACTR